MNVIRHACYTVLNKEQLVSPPNAVRLQFLAMNISVNVVIPTNKIIDQKGI